MILKSTMVQKQKRLSPWLFQTWKKIIMVHKAIREVMESTPKGVQAIADQKIIDAAGVEHMDGQASNSIQDAANWNNLANFLKIEKGVDNQGPNMLEKVARTFDGDHEWRPQPIPTVCCLPRWVASVKALAEYNQNELYSKWWKLF